MPIAAIAGRRPGGTTSTRASMHLGQSWHGGQLPLCLRRLSRPPRPRETFYLSMVQTWLVLQEVEIPKSMIDHDDLFSTQMRALGFSRPELPADPPGPAAMAAADRISRYWTSTHVGALRPGSEAHKREVCRMFHETFNPYRPSIISWPKLSPEILQRVTSLAIWDVAVHTESRARLRFASYASSGADPEVLAAVARNACEP